MKRPDSQSTRIRNPMPDATDEQLKLENALLYRRIIMLEVQNIKFCAALEFATGVPWDEINLEELDAGLTERLAEVVAQNMARGLDLSIEDSRARVQEHGRIANRTQIETPA